MPQFKPAPICQSADPSAGASGAAGVRASPEGLDASAIARLRELDPTGQARLVERVVDAYLGSAERLGAQLREARDRGDVVAVRMVAHTLKSSSASVGALALSRQCAETEAMARDRGWVPELPPAIDALLERLAAAVRDLEALKGTGPA